jgi:hypothetical protein
MDFIKKNAKDFTIVWIHVLPKAIFEYKNSGNRHAMQWLYIIDGNLQIDYTFNGYNGAYILTTDVLADLRPINDLETTWVTEDQECHCVGFIPANQTDVYDAEIINIDNVKKIEISDRDRYFIPLTSGIKVNNIPVEATSYIKIPANKSSLAQTDHAGSTVLIVTLIDD